MQERPNSFEWPAKSDAWRPPTLDGLRSEYEETIEYINSRGKQAFSHRDSMQAQLEESREKPDLSVGDLLLVKPGEDDGMHQLPFWIAEVAQPVPKEISSIPITWRSAFKNSLAVNDVNGQWHAICKGSVSTRGGHVRYHPYTVKCTVRGQDIKGHGKMESTVERSEVALYFPKLTKDHARM